MFGNAFFTIAITVGLLVYLLSLIIGQMLWYRLDLLIRQHVLLGYYGL